MAKNLDWNAPIEYLKEDWKAAVSSEIFRNYVKISLNKEAIEQEIADNEKIKKEALEKVNFGDSFPKADENVYKEIVALAAASPLRSNFDYGTERNVKKEKGGKGETTGAISEGYDSDGVTISTDSDWGAVTSCETQPEGSPMKSASTENNIEKYAAVESELGLDNNMYYQILKARKG